jgi:hypothetical protein
MSTSQGHARPVFRRAFEHENLLVAEATAKEIGRISLAEALELTVLIARKNPRRHPRVAARWLLRYLEEGPEARSTGGDGSKLPRRALWRAARGGAADATSHGRRNHSRRFLLFRPMGGTCQCANHPTLAATPLSPP